MTINRVLTYSIIVGILLSLLIPFIVTPQFFFPFITGKNFAFRILAELIFGFWLILILRDATFRPKFSWLLTAIAVFVALIGIADIFSPNVMKSFWSNFERMEGYITLLHLFAYFLVVSSVLRSEKLWSRFFQMSVGASVLMGFYGILQLAGKITINQGGVRLDGRLGNASYLAAYMLFNFFFALFLLVRSRKSKVLPWVYGMIMTLQLFILYHTATRGAILGLMGGLIIISLLTFFYTKEKKLRWINLGILGFIVTVILLGATLKETQFVENQPSLVRLTSISTKEAGPRFMVWNMAWQGFKERPVVGWGQESFNYVFNKYYDPGMYAQEQWFDRTHNVVFDWLIAGGILGLLAYLSIFVFALYYVWKQGDFSFSIKKCVGRVFPSGKDEATPYLLEKVILTGLIAAYFFQNLFVFDNITSYLLFFALLAYIHSISSWETKWFTRVLKVEPATVNRVFVPLLSVAMVFLMYTANYAPVRAAETLINALQPQQEGPSKNLGSFKEALSYKTFGNPEIREQLTQASLQVLYTQSLPLALKQEYYDFTQKELVAQIAKTPNDARYHLFLGSFLNRAGNVDEAIAILKKALELSPKKQTIMFELGSAYLNKGDVDNAFLVMKEAFLLDEDFNEARIIYAVAAVYKSEFALAQEVMESVTGTDMEFDSRLVQAYTNMGQHEIVSRLLEKRIKMYPGDSQARFSLSGAYLNRNMRTKAIEILKMIITDFPDQKDQADYYIREIQAGRNP